MELYHAPRFRSTRVIILYKELLRAYCADQNGEASVGCTNIGAEENAKTLSKEDFMIMAAY